MNHEQVLASLKFVRNTFDTIGIECGMKSRKTIDMWAEILSSGDESEAVPFSYFIQNATTVLRGLLYSIDKVAKDFSNLAEVDSTANEAQTKQETEAEQGDDL
jgi:hypothetical protein